LKEIVVLGDNVTELRMTAGRFSSREDSAEYQATFKEQ